MKNALNLSPTIHIPPEKSDKKKSLKIRKMKIEVKGNRKQDTQTIEPNLKFQKKKKTSFQENHQTQAATSKKRQNGSAKRRKRKRKRFSYREA